MPLVAVGKKAPSFTLPDHDGAPWSLEAQKGKPVVLYFYPKDDTPGCTTEACDFRDRHPSFTETGVVVVGISPDGPQKHARFARKHGLTFTLLADEKNASGTPAVCDAYGVWAEKTLYGKTSLGVVRTTYLIGADGVVKARWDKVKVAGHADAVLEAARKL